MAFQFVFGDGPLEEVVELIVKIKNQVVIVTVSPRSNIYSYVSLSGQLQCLFNGEEK